MMTVHGRRISVRISFACIYVHLRFLLFRSL